MKYSEATKLIKGLSKKYSINNDDKSIFEIDYKYKPIAWVGNLESFNFGRATSASEFSNMPYSHKLWMILAELAMTPLDKRKEENKWNVIVGNDDSESDYIICWGKEDSNSTYVLCLADSNSLKMNSKTFTDDEYSDLVKHIKTLPDGEWQAKVAEHGKTEAKE